MPPTAVVVDAINIPGDPEMGETSPLQEFKAKLVGLEARLPPDHELARWTEATSVSNLGLLRRK